MPDMDSGPKPDWGQERVRIDKGLTHEKVAVTDPAAAPMETDSESGGAALPAMGHRWASLAWRIPRPDTFGAWRKPGQHEGPLGRRLLLLGAALVALGIGLGLYGLM